MPAYNSTLPEDAKVLKYKAAGGQANNAKGGGPWGVRRSLTISTSKVVLTLTEKAANTMGNGKDFFIELRKQILALQQGGERAGG